MSSSQNLLKRCAAILQDYAFGLQDRMHLLRELGGLKPSPRQLNLSELEDRILLSASPVGAVAPDGFADAGWDVAPVQTADLPSAESGYSSGAQEVATAETSIRHELVVIDPAADDYQQLVDDLLLSSGQDREFEILLLDESRDGIEQISELLADYKDVDAIHLVSHGFEGNVRLGSATLNLNNLAAYAGQIGGWHDSLSADADVLIYGCNLAANDDGRELVDALSILTEADVAASDNLTGHESLGGDWNFEFTVGLIETDVAFSADMQDEWRHILPTIKVNVANSTLGYTEDDGPVVIDSGFNTQFGNPLFVSATVQITPGTYQFGEDFLSYTGATGGLAIAQTDDSIIFSGSATRAFYEALLQTVEYTNTSIDPDLTTRVVEFTINDGSNTDMDSRDISINAVNSTPTVDRNNNLSVTEESSVVITNADLNFIDDDHNASALTYTLTNIVGLDGQLNLSGFGALGLNDTFTQQDIDAGFVSYDSMGEDSTATFDFNVRDNHAPPAVTSTYTFTFDVTNINDDPNFTSPGAVSVAENTTNALTVSAFDPEAAPVQYFIVGGEDASKFSIGLTTGLLTFDTAPDYENPTDVGLNNTYKVTVEARDGVGGITPQNITVTVTDYNEVPVNTVPGTQTTPSNTPLTLSVANGNQVSTTDENGGPITVTLTTVPGEGTITLRLPYDAAIPTGPESRVNTETTGTQTEPKVARAADGRYVVAWSGNGGSGGSADSDGIFIQRYNADGSTSGVEERMNGNTNKGKLQYAPDVAINDSGRVVVTWVGFDQDAAGTDGIFAATADWGAGPSGEIAINFNTAGKQDLPAVDIDAAGNFVVVWTDHTALDSHTRGVFGRRFDAAGNPRDGASQFLVNSYTFGQQQRADIAMHTDGSFVVVWDGSHGEVGGTQEAVFGKRFDAAGVALDAPGTPGEGEFQINSYTFKEQAAPAIAMDGSGNFVVAWHSQDQDGDNNGIYGKRYRDDGYEIDAPGTPGEGEFRISSHSPKDQDAVSIAMDADGDFVVVWQSENQDNPGELDGGFPTVRGIYAQQFANDGTTVGGETLINSTIPGHQRTPDVAMDANGEFIAVWQGNGTTDADGVFRRGYENPPNTLVISTGSGVNDTTVTFSGTQTEVNDALNGMIFTPDPAFLTGTTTLTILTDDQGNSGPGGNQFDTDIININVVSAPITPIVDIDSTRNAVIETAAPTTTVGITAFADDPDVIDTVSYSLDDSAGGMFAIDSLSGVVTLVGALDAEVTSNYSITVRALSLDGSFSTRTFHIAVDDVAEVNALWFATAGDVTASGNPDQSNWDNEEVLQFGDPSLNFDPAGGTTTGELNDAGFDLSNFGAGVNARIDAIHHVYSDMTVAGFALQAGDVLLSVDDPSLTVTLSSNTEPNKTFDINDVFLFRPLVAGDYSTGDFFHLLDNPLSALGATQITGVSLVESAAGTLVGDTTLAQGTFLLTHDAPGAEDRIYVFAPTSVGDGTTSGPAPQILLEGSDTIETANSGNLGFSQAIDGIHVVEYTTMIGNAFVNAGDILISTAGTATIDITPVEGQDVTLLRMTNTRIGNNHSLGTATLLFDGSDEAMLAGDTAEDISALTFVEGATVNQSPTGSVTISGTPTEDQMLTADNTLADADGLGPIGYQWKRDGVDIGGATASTYTLGDLDVNKTITVVASYTDGGGTNESVTSAGVGPIANVNDPPTITPIADQTVLESGSTGNLSFTIGDVEAPVGSLIVTATSDNQTIIPNANVVVGGGGANRTVTVTPAAGQFGGPVTITVTVDDGENSTQETFAVIVVPRIITVTTTLDENDGDTTDILTLINSSGGTGVSLREAILATNNTLLGVTPDEIHFNFANGDPGHLYYKDNGAAGFAAPTVTDGTDIDFDVDDPYDRHSWFRIDMNGGLSQLTVTDDVIIDGYTQAGATGNTLSMGQNAALRVELTNTGSDGFRGLTFDTGSDGSTVRGLAINGFDWAGVMVEYDVDNVTVQGNFIGTDITGTVDLGNGDAGIHLRGNSALVGGPNVEHRNVISGSNSRGVTLYTLGTITGNTIENNYIGADATGLNRLGNAGNAGIQLYGGDGTRVLDNVIVDNASRGIWFHSSSTNVNSVIQGNLIGLGADGSTQLGNVGVGIEIAGTTSNNTIGGIGAGQENVISDNTSHGILITGAGVANDTIVGDLIGTDATGLLNRGNSDNGIFVASGANRQTIGGILTDEGNVIAFNSGAGIGVKNAGTDWNTIRGNSIYSNTGLGIDIRDDGLVQANDPGDGDNGANQRQNFPVLTSATISGFDLIVNGSLNSTPSTAFDFDFYASATADASSHGEAERYIGSALGISTNGSGNLTLSELLTGANVVAGEFITATATDAFGNTSEFALNVVATDPNTSPTGSVTISGTPTEDEILTAGNTLADADGLGLISYQWQRNGVDIAGATATTYALGDADVNTMISVVASYLDGGGTNETVSSLAVGPIANVNDAPSGSVTISGTATEDQILAASNTLADADGLGPISYQWKRDGIDIGGATASTYTLGDLDVNTTITVVASYTDGWLTAESVTSAGVGPIANVNDLPTGSVTISGTPTEDQTLTAGNTLADADGLGPISYQWKRDGVDIGGATASTYTLGDLDVNKTITVVAGYTDGWLTAESVSSGGVGPIANVNDAPTGAVTISGTPQEGQILTAANTLADADGIGPISYQWKRNGLDIGGATATTYTLVAADVSTTITVVASYTDGWLTSESVSSAGIGPIAPINFLPTGSVTISGTATEDQVLTASNTLADADGLGPISYQWRRDGVDISGATATSYTLGDADVNTMITVVVSYTDGGGTSESVSSAGVGPIANVNDAPTGSVTISGSPTEDQILTASNTLADVDGPGIISYQWQRNGIDITGATATSYTLDDADVNTTISVVASYTDGWGTAESVTSAGAGPIANVNDAPTGAVTISGTATEDQILTASNTLADADGLGIISYQWQRDGVDISGATASTFTLGDADVNTTITVVASYTDGWGTAETVSSPSVGPIANVNDVPTGAVTISGTPTRYQILTASNSLADADGLGLISYQWQRDGVDISGATGTTYTLADADVGTLIRVVASYTDGHGTPESIRSVAVGPVVDFNNAPIASGFTTTIAENTVNGTGVGIVTASDVDAGDILSYAITGGNTNNAFAIDAAGDISVNNSAQLDVEAVTVFVLTVQVTDDGTGLLSDTVTVTINLTDVDEFDVGPLTDVNTAANSYTIGADPNVTGVTALAVDVDATDSVTYSLDNNAGGRFAIDPLTGVVSWIGSPFDAAAVQTIIVRATSSDGSSTTGGYDIDVSPLFAPAPVTPDAEPDSDDTTTDSDPAAVDAPEIAPTVETSEPAAAKKPAENSTIVPNEEIAGLAIVPEDVVAVILEQRRTDQQDDGTWRKADPGSYTRARLTGSNPDSETALAGYERQLQFLSRPTALWDALDNNQSELNEAISSQTLVLGTTGVVTSGFTVGYVLWILRGGALISSVLAQMPAWSLMDPMLVLQYHIEEDENAESLEEIFDNHSSSNESKPTPVA